MLQFQAEIACKIEKKKKDFSCINVVDAQTVPIFQSFDGC